MKTSVKLLAVLSALCMLLTSLCSCDLSDFSLIDEDGSFIGLNGIIDRVFGDGDMSASIESENYEVDAKMLCYFFVKEYSSFRSKFSNYYSYIGLDEGRPLGEQYFDDQTGYAKLIIGDFSGTWLEYFTEKTEESVTDVLWLCEYALANGLADKALAEYSDEELNDMASKYLSELGVVPATLGDIYSCVSVEDVRKCVELFVISGAGEADIAQKAQNGITDGEIEAEFHSNQSEYQVVDYLSYTFEVDIKDIAADVLGKDYTEEEFNENYGVIHNRYTKEIDKIKNDADTISYSGDLDTLARYIAEREGLDVNHLDEYKTIGDRYKDMDKEAADWAFFGKGEGAILSIEENNDKEEFSLTVYCLLTAPYTLRSKNFSYMAFSDEKLALEANEKFRHISNQDAESFTSFAEKYAADKYERIENYVKGGLSTIALNDIKIQYSANGNLASNGSIVNDGSYKYYTTTVPEESSGKVYYSATVPDGSNGAVKYDIATGGDNKVYYSYSGSQLVDGKYQLSDSIIKDFNVYAPQYGLSGIINASAVDEWLFDGDRKAGDVTDKPIKVGNEYYILFLEGDGEYCWFIEIQEQMTADRAQRMRDSLKGQFASTITGGVGDLFEGI